MAGAMLFKCVFLHENHNPEALSRGPQWITITYILGKLTPYRRAKTEHLDSVSENLLLNPCQLPLHSYC